MDACFAEDQVPDEWAKYIPMNADYFKNTLSAAPGRTPRPRGSSRPSAGDMPAGFGAAGGMTSSASGIIGSVGSGDRRQRDDAAGGLAQRLGGRDRPGPR